MPRHKYPNLLLPYNLHRSVSLSRVYASLHTLLPHTIPNKNFIMSGEGSSSSSNVNLSRIPLLTGSTDYTRWALAVNASALLADVHDVLIGEEAEPTVLKAEDDGYTESLKELKAWRKANKKAIGLMLVSCSEDLQLALTEFLSTPLVNPLDENDKRSPNAHDLWKHLASKYKKKDGISAAIEWGNLISQQMVEGTPIEEQIAERQTRRTRLALNKFLFPDWQFAILILLRLPPSFDTLRSSFLDGLENPEELSLKNFIARAIDKDNWTTVSNLNVMGNRPTSCG